MCVALCCSVQLATGSRDDTLNSEDENVTSLATDLITVLLSRTSVVLLTLQRAHYNRRATGHYTAIRWLVHWPLMAGLLHLVQRGGGWAGCNSAQSRPRCTKCNSPPINGQCTNFILLDVTLSGVTPIGQGWTNARGLRGLGGP